MNFNFSKAIGTVVLCSFAGSSAPAWAADVAAGRAVYNTRCKTCHGAEGEGNEAVARALKANIKPLSESAGMSEADLKKVITGGKGKMKAISLSGANLDNVVAFVKSLKK